MDEHERRRKRGDSNFSTESAASNSSVESFGSHRDVLREGNRRSEDVQRRSTDGGNVREEGVVSKVKGRLRAFTGERKESSRREFKVVPYPGT